MKKKLGFMAVLAMALVFSMAAQETKGNNVIPAELVGRWTYRLASHTVTYIFTADGKMTAEADGQLNPNPPSDVTVQGNVITVVHPSGLSGSGEYKIAKGVLSFSKIKGQPGFGTVGKFKKE